MINSLLNKFNLREANKQLTEQAASMVCLQSLGLDYKNKKEKQSN